MAQRREHTPLSLVHHQLVLPMFPPMPWQPDQPESTIRILLMQIVIARNNHLNVWNKIVNRTAHAGCGIALNQGSSRAVWVLFIAHVASSQIILYVAGLVFLLFTYSKQSGVEWCQQRVEVCNDDRLRPSPVWPLSQKPFWCQASHRPWSLSNEHLNVSFFNQA